MPKIKKETLRIREGEIDELVEYSIFYTTDFGFFAELPAGVHEPFDTLNDKELAALFCDKKYLRKWRQDAGHKKIVFGETEAQLKDRMRVALVHFYKMTVKKEAVIIVRFDDRSDPDPDPDDFVNPTELPEVGLEFSAVYCFKVQTSGGKAKYYQEYEREWMGENHTERHEVHVSTHDPEAIIPDTPENRKFVEDLHGALKQLVTKLRKFTKTSASFTKAIETRQKFLTYNNES